jgi:predicted flap endonuclease-1-like 5' DNA nuclease
MANDKYILGLFDHEDKLINAIRAFKEKGIEITNTLTPFPVHGLETELGLKENRLHTAGFIFGITGMLLALFIMSWVTTSNYPVNIGGKPFWAIPAFIPIIFELTVLFAAVGMVMVYMKRNNLSPGHIPRIYDDRITDDRFVLLFEVDNNTTQEDISAITSTLTDSHASEIKMKEFDDNGEPFSSIEREFNFSSGASIPVATVAPVTIVKEFVADIVAKVEEVVVVTKSEEEYKNLLLDVIGTATEADKDDIKRIKGIGKVFEGKLNSIGIYTFSQISKLNESSITAVEALTRFPGRVTREDWIGQAKTLSEGGKTDFSNRVDKGDVDY